MEPARGSEFTYKTAEIEYEKLGKWESFATKLVAIIAAIFTFGALYESAFTWMVKRLIDPNSTAGKTADKVDQLVNKESVRADARAEAKKQFEDFFHNIGKDGGVILLKDKEHGSFLVRNSENEEWRNQGGYTITVIWEHPSSGEIFIDNRRFKIDGHGRFKTRDVTYDTFEDMVRAFHGNPRLGVTPTPL